MPKRPKRGGQVLSAVPFGPRRLDGPQRPKGRKTGKTSMSSGVKEIELLNSTFFFGITWCRALRK